MPWSRTPLSRLIRRQQSDLEARVAGLTAKIKHTVEYGLARAQAAAVHMLHGHIGWVARQIFPDTADEEYVVRSGEIFKTPRKQAGKAAGEVIVTGNAAAIVPIDTEIQYLTGDPEIDANAPRYRFTAAVTLPLNGETTGAVEALEPGAAGNLPGSAVLSFISPVPNVDADVTVSEDAPIADGTDLEPLDPDYRERVLFAWRNPPKGGGPGDYVQWAEGVAGVTRSWELGNVPNPGAVTVLIVNDTQDPITPTQALIDAVQAYLESKAPITATVYTEAPTLIALDPDISLDDDTPELREAVAAELKDLLENTDYRAGELKLSQIDDAISNAPGWTGHTLNSPVSNITYGAKEIPVVGTITW